MNIKLISFDSMGLRSMATFIETYEGGIFIDPGSALAPTRYGLPPHESELKLLARKLDLIYRLMKEADYIVLTHYHRDHYLYRRGEEDHYSKKVIYAKNPYLKTNYNQRVRAYTLFKKMGVENLAKKIVYADNLETKIGSMKLVFSSPLPHGECKTRLGSVIALFITNRDQSLLFASDTQGFICEDALKFAKKHLWNTLIVSGPPTYLKSNTNPEEILGNLLEALNTRKNNDVIAIVDHHLLRDKDYLVYFDYLRKNSSARVMTAAEFMNQPIKQLEAYRDKLWQKARVEKNSI
ncbi:MAG: MBL fold metallo-hydrolase [Desulfurococcaceae archaeon]